MEIFLIAAGIAAVVAFVGWYNSAHRTLVRKLRAAPVVKVRDAPDGGFVRIVGTLEYAGEPLTAPLSRRPCASFHVLVEEHRGKRREKILEAGDQLDFLVRDDTGVALVRALSPEVAIVKDNHYQSGSLLGPKATPEMKAFLEHHGEPILSEGWVLTTERVLHYEEGVLEAGETVAVLGRASWEPDPDPQAAGGGYRERARRLVLYDPEGPGTMLISDDPAAIR